MDTPQTFQIIEQNPDPNSPLGIRLALTTPDPDNTTKINSFSIPVVLSKDGKDSYEGKITILEGSDSWIRATESIIYYKVNTVINDKAIPSVVYHHSIGDEEACFVTLLSSL
jgi:hypothetical protein